MLPGGQQAHGPDSRGDSRSTIEQIWLKAGHLKDTCWLYNYAGRCLFLRPAGDNYFIALGMSGCAFDLPQRATCYISSIDAVHDLANSKRLPKRILIVNCVHFILHFFGYLITSTFLSYHFPVSAVCSVFGGGDAGADAAFGLLMLLLSAL